MLAMMAQGTFLIFLLCICVSQGNSFTFPRSSNRRPRTRLFGTSSGLSAAPTRYSMEPRRPSVRPFRIPGFERSQASITSSRASRLGFDLGLGGRALSDPIASMYDSAGGIGGSRLNYVNGVGDIGGFDTFGGGGDMYGGSLGFNDGLITAANTRDLKMRDINSAGTRLRQPIDIGNYGNQMISSSAGLGGSGILSNQGQQQNFDLSYDNIGGGNQYLLSAGGSRQQGGLGLNQASLDQQSGQLLGGSGGNQIGLGSNTWLGLDSSDYRTSSGAGLSFSSNQIGSLGGSNSADLSLNSGANYGVSNFNNDQLGSGFDTSHVDLSLGSLASNPVDLGLNSLGSNQVGLGTNQMSTNQLGSMVTSQQGFLGQGPVGGNENTLNAQLGQSQMGMDSGHQLSSMAVQNSVVGTSLSNQVSSNGFGNSLGFVGSSLSGDSVSALAVPTQGTLTDGGQYLSTNDGQVVNIGLQSNARSQHQPSGALSNSPPASPMPTLAAPSPGQYASGSNIGHLTSDQSSFRHASHDGSLGQFAAPSNTGQLGAAGTDMGQMSSGGSHLGHFSAGGESTGSQFVLDQGNMVGQFSTGGGNMGQVQAGNGLGQLASQNQNLVAEKNGYSAGTDGMGQYSVGNGGVNQFSTGQAGEGFGQFVSGVSLSKQSQGVEGSSHFSQDLGGSSQFSQGMEGTGQFSQDLGASNQFSLGVSSKNQFSQGGAGGGQFSQGLDGSAQFSQGQLGTGQIPHDESKSGQFVSGGDRSSQFLLDSGQVGGISQNSVSTGLSSQSAPQNVLLS